MLKCKKKFCVEMCGFKMYNYPPVSQVRGLTMIRGYYNFVLEAQYETVHIRTIHNFFIATKFDFFTANIKL